MTYATLPLPSQKITATRQYLTEEQVLCLVDLVKERNKLLENKKDSLILDEERIRIKGDRAFNALVAEHTNLIWLLIHRFNVSDRITPDEMYQIALQEVNNAINRHNSNREGRTARFKNWLFLHIRSKFICLFKIELSFVQRNERYRTQLINTNSFANEETPLKVAIEADLREQIKQVVMSTLDEGQATTIKAYFFEGLQYVSIAHRLGEKPGTIEMRSTRGRKKLKENPRLQELAQEYFA